MTKITSAQASNSELRGISASLLIPAEAVSTPGHSANTCSAVGLRRRFLLQRKSRFSTQCRSYVPLQIPVRFHEKSVCIWETDAALRRTLTRHTREGGYPETPT